MRRRVVWLAVASLAAGLVPLGIAARAEPANQAGPTRQAGQASRSAQDGPVIRVGSDPIADPVPDAIVGANHRWLNDGLGMWDATNERPLPAIVELARQTGLELVRYPGGTVANLFDWKKAIGPPDDRGCQVAAGFVGEQGTPLPASANAYGPDENERFVQEIGGRTTIMTNGSGQPASDAADYVEYMNAEAGENPNGGTDWAAERDRNKQRLGMEPGPYGVDLWEVGNEPFLGNQHYWRSPDMAVGLRQYAFGGTQKQVEQPVGTECDHRESASRSDGSANQVFQVRYPPIAPDTPVTLQVGSSDDTWTPVEDLGGAGPDEKVFELDRDTGEIRFGNGRDGQGNGKAPIQGAHVRATYSSGPHPGFVDYYRAMKQVDPSISVCSAWETPEFVELMGTDHPYDCIGPHLYTNPVKSPDPETMHDDAMPRISAALGELDALEEAIDRHGPSDPRPFLEVSEYGQIPHGEQQVPPDWGGSLSTTLQFGSFAIGMVKRDIPSAVSSNLNRGQPTSGELFGGAPDFLNTARARALAMFGELAGSQPIENQTENNPIADGGYEALRVLATETEGGTVRLFVVNRARGLNLSTQVQLPGSAPAAGELTVRTLNGDRLDSANTSENPDAVRVTTSSHEWSDRGFVHQFPAHSITMIEVPAAG